MAALSSAATGAVTLAKTMGALALLQATLPVDLVVTGVAAARGRAARCARPDPGATAAERRTVLVSGGKMTKALEIARLMHLAGHRVVMVETRRYRLTGHRFSRAVDAFHVVPDISSPDYAAALLRVVRQEGVDVYVPVCSPAASIADAEAKRVLEPHCEVVHLDPDDLRRVDDKHLFAESAAALGLAVPDTHRITDPQQVLDFDFSRSARPYILKSIPYDPVRRLDLTRLPLATREETAAHLARLPISPEHPFILQEFVEGEEYCTHGTVRDGRLQVYICCRSSAWQLTYEMVDKPAIREWVETYVAAHGLTGQLSFDFIEDAEGVVRAIECNPRTHSAITLLHGHPGVAAAYLDDDAPAVEPPLGGRPTHWTYHELWQGLRHPRTLPGRLRTLARGRDAVLDPADPLPFLMLHHVHVPSLLLQNLRRLRPWTKVDLNIGKLVEPGGD
ncbi:hypothetical protein [Nocardioides sp. Leaf374]|uniref:hypothetical protein n=1 Tax=Nocardioides sp. Leaf374 TaxID=2876560 RepID=UPI001E60276C|nr:hypothetical protein [Nocardioides sp. Leaf374]